MPSPATTLTRRQLIRRTLASLFLAPAPTFRAASNRRQPTFQSGTYALSFANDSYRAVFRFDGTYQATSSNGCTWVGSWSWDEATHTLTVDERRQLDDGTVSDLSLRWSVRLETVASGDGFAGVTGSGGTAVRIVPHGGKAVR